MQREKLEIEVLWSMDINICFFMTRVSEDEREHFWDTQKTSSFQCLKVCSRRIQAWEACKAGSFTCAADVILELRMQTTMFMPHPYNKNPNYCPRSTCMMQSSKVFDSFPPPCFYEVVVCAGLNWFERTLLSLHSCLLPSAVALSLHEKAGKVLAFSFF